MKAAKSSQRSGIITSQLRQNNPVQRKQVVVLKDMYSIESLFMQIVLCIKMLDYSDDLDIGIPYNKQSMRTKAINNDDKKGTRNQ